MLEWGSKTLLMGIINLTPDSFSGDGVMQEQDPVKFAVKKARQFIHEGADILDLGAESSRPGSKPISADDELERLIPVLKALKNESVGGIISIDTYKSKVAKRCLECGANWINDIWGLKKDYDLADVIAQFGVPVILIHNRSRLDAVEQNERLGDSYESAKYLDFLSDVKNDLLESVDLAIQAGIKKENIVLDPGIGFGKTVEQNLLLINYLHEIKAMGYPVMIGPSRKSFIGRILELPIENRLEGTAATLAVSIARGADIVRVHDIKYMSRVVKVTDAIVRGTR